MSITFCVGIPRSGKTYYATYQIYNHFLNAKTKSDKYNFCYTNINQFRFNKCEKFKKYEHDIFYEQLKILHSMYSNKANDEELLIKAKEFGICNSLYVIDECHNDFLYGKYDDVLTWFLTYHGHLFVDIYFITQNLSLIPAPYKKLGEFFIQAIPPTRRLFVNKMRYITYTGYQLYKKDRDKDFTIPKLYEVFELYVSGANNNSKSSVKRLFYIFLFISLVVFVLSYYFVSSINPNKKTENTNFQTPTNTNTNKKISLNNSLNTKPIEEKKINKNNYSDLYIYKIICVNRKNCIINNKDNIDYEVLQYILLNSEKIYSNNSYSDATTIKITLIYDFDIFKNFIEKKGKDLKNEKDGNSLFGIR